LSKLNWFAAYRAAAKGSSASAVRRAPLMAREVYVAANAARLLPSEERMVLGEALPERGSLFDQIGVVSSLWRGFEQPVVLDA